MEKTVRPEKKEEKKERETEKQRYTIIDGDKGAPFIQQHYDSLEDAKRRLDLLKAKFADRFPLLIVGVDSQGKFHKLSDKQETS